MKRIGVALSGGGHRASAWAVGVLAAVIDAGLAENLTSVSSVSGGSITNGVAASKLDLRTATSDDFDRAMTPLMKSIATDGLFFPGPRTRTYVRGLFAMAGFAVLLVVATLAAVVAASRELDIWWFLLAGVLPLALLPALRRIWLGIVAAALVVAATSVGGAAATNWISGWAAIGVCAALAAVTLAALWAALWMLTRRGRVVERALEATHFPGPGAVGSTLLADFDRSVHHLVLATDLEAGDQFYLTPRFLYGFREGIADPGPSSTTMARAVAASAALPGAFPPTTVEVNGWRRPWPVPSGQPAEGPKRVVLSDGGVYDNMAEQWEFGFESRTERWVDLADTQEPAELLIVANASAAWNWRPFGSANRYVREITGLTRDQGVQYDQSTTRRRAAALARFRQAEAEGKGLMGVIVMIDRSPYRACDAFREWPNERQQRAIEAFEHLGGDDQRNRWSALAQDNADVPTTLGPIGEAPTLDLIEHAYVSTLVNLYVIHGLGELRACDRGRFQALIRG